jgi:hypothetical protein
LYDYIAATLSGEEKAMTSKSFTGLADSILGTVAPSEVANMERDVRNTLLRSSIELLLNRQAAERLDNTDMFAQIPPSMRLLQGSTTYRRPAIVLNYHIERLQ